MLTHDSQVFDKVAVLYEGRQIYFGDKDAAKRFFVDMGFICADRATTGDFLTSITNPKERRARRGFESRVPCTPDEFATRWRESDDRAALMQEIKAFNTEFPVGGDGLARFREARVAAQAKYLRPKSPFTITLAMQIKLCMKRGFMRIRRDLSLTLTNVIGNSAVALVTGSVCGCSLDEMKLMDRYFSTSQPTRDPFTLEVPSSSLPS